MKLRITLKDPDGVSESLKNAALDIQNSFHGIKDQDAVLDQIDVECERLSGDARNGSNGESM